LKINILEIIKEDNTISGKAEFNNTKYPLIIENEVDGKKISLPFDLGNQLPLQNFTSKPLSRIRLIVKLQNSENKIIDGLRVDRDLAFKKKAIKEALWLSGTVQPIKINSDPLFDFAKTLLNDLEILEIT